MRQLFPPLVIYGTARLASKSLAIQPGALGMEGVGSLCCGPSTVLVTGHWSLVTVVWFVWLSKRSAGKRKG